MNKVAVEFVRDVLKQNPGVNGFGAIYDAMARAACARSFYNLGYEELALTGVSFSLLATSELECLIADAQKTILLECEERKIN